MICSFYLYLTPCLNLVIHTQSSTTKKKGKNKHGLPGGKGKPGLPQLSKEEKAKQRENDRRRERRACQRKEHDKVRSAIGLSSLSSDKGNTEKFAKPGPARDQLEMFKKNFEVWDAENSLLPESERKTFSWYHREIIGGEVVLSESSFRVYLVNDTPLPELRMMSAAGAKALLPDEAMASYMVRWLTKWKLVFSQLILIQRRAFMEEKQVTSQ